MIRMAKIVHSLGSTVRHGLAGAAVCLASVPALAAAPPCSQIRIIVPFSAGGASDITARVVADPLAKALDKVVVVENRVGATGNIGTAMVARSAADGCTLVVNVSAILTYQWIFSDLGYDPEKDLVAVGGVGESPTTIVTSTSNPANNLKDLIAKSKQSPAGLTYATAGLGLMPHLAVERLARIGSAKFVPVFYKGAPDFMVDVMTNRVSFASTSAANVMPLVRAGKLKALAVMQNKRSSLAPDVPSSAEQGIAINSSSYFMLFARGGTPKATVDTLSSEVKKIVSEPAVSARLRAAGFDPAPAGAEEAATIVRTLGQDWEPLVKSLHLKPN